MRPRPIFFLSLLLFIVPPGGLLPPIYALEAPKITIPPHHIESSDSPSSASSLSVGTWNVRWFPGRTPFPKDPEAPLRHRREISGILQKQSPDILFLCEIRNLDALTTLNLPYPYILCTDIPRPSDENSKLPNQGLALLSKIPWEEIWCLDFSALAQTPDRPRRGILGVKFSPPQSPPITLYGLHLKSNRGQPENNRWRRERAIEYLEWDLNRRKLTPMKDPIIILGDFNTSLYDPVFRHEQTLRRLLSLGFLNPMDALPPGNRDTLPKTGLYPSNTFDYILVSPPLAALASSNTLWPKIIPVPPSASDHFLLLLPLKTEHFQIKPFSYVHHHSKPLFGFSVNAPATHRDSPLAHP